MQEETKSYRELIDEGPSEDDLRRFGYDKDIGGELEYEQEYQVVPCPSCSSMMYHDADMCPACGAYIMRDGEYKSKGTIRNLGMSIIVFVLIVALLKLMGVL